MPLRADGIGIEIYEASCFIAGLEIEVRELKEMPAEHDAVGVASAGEVTGNHMCAECGRRIPEHDIAHMDR